MALGRLLAPLLLFSAIAMAQDVPTLEDIEQSPELDLQLESELKADLRAIDFKSVDNLIGEEDEKRKQKYRRLRFKPREKPWSPVPYKSLLKKYSTLEELDTGKQIKVGRQFFVLAREKVQGSQTAYIYDSSGKFKYKTHTSNLISIQGDLDLTPPIDPLITYDEPDSFHSNDPALKFESEISLHGENIKAQFVRELLGTESKTAAGNRLDLTTYYRSIMPVQFGLSLSYQTAVLEDITGTYTWNNLFFGPMVKWAFYHKRKVEWNLQAGFQQSIFFDLRDSTSYYALSSNSFQLEMQRIKQAKWGKWFLGASYRRLNPHVKSTDPDVVVDSDRGLIESYALSIGYRLDWEL